MAKTASKTKYYPMPDEVRIKYFNPLIAEQRPDLAEAKFVLLFREGKWAAKDKTTWASVKKVNAETKALLKEAYSKKYGFQDDTLPADFVIIVNHQVWQSFMANDQARYALLHHELCHCFKDNDKYGNPRYSLVAHDLEEFNEIVRLYGNWSEDCRLMFEAMKKGGQQVLSFEKPGKEQTG